VSSEMKALPYKSINYCNWVYHIVLSIKQVDFTFEEFEEIYFLFNSKTLPDPWWDNDRQSF
jgi:hypothetical protein